MHGIYPGPLQRQARRHEYTEYPKGAKGPTPALRPPQALTTPPLPMNPIFEETLRHLLNDQPLAEFCDWFAQAMPGEVAHAQHWTPEH
jgi:hypothetical protein